MTSLPPENAPQLVTCPTCNRTHNSPIIEAGGWSICNDSFHSSSPKCPKCGWDGPTSLRPYCDDSWHSQPVAAPENQPRPSVGTILGHAIQYLNDQSPKNWAAVEIINKAWGEGLREYVFGKNQVGEAQKEIASQLVDLKDDWRWLQEISTAMDRKRTAPDDLDSMLKWISESRAEVERLQEALRDRDGIIVGLKEMIEGKTKPFSQIQAELEGGHL